MQNSILGRRQVLQGLGAGALAATLGGCAKSTPATSNTGFVRPLSRQPMVAPKIASHNIVRQVVGHRPFRPQGFVVRSEPFGDKTLVHNYGHGGGGISLSWGSAALAVAEVAKLEHKRAAIIGAGVMGLTTARLLQQSGWQVTIYTRKMPQYTTSQVAGGEWGPYSVHDPKRSTDAFKQQLQQAAQIAHHTFSSLVGSYYGIQWRELYTCSATEPDAHSEFSRFYPYRTTYGPGEHPFNAEYCTASATMIVETPTFLRRLIEDVRLAGGNIQIRDFQDQQHISELPEPVIFNCTGLGSRTLFGDENILPAKGQLALLPPDPAVDYLTVGGSEQPLYMFSRGDCMILGGTFKPNDWTTEPEPAETERIIAEHQQLFAGLT